MIGLMLTFSAGSAFAQSAGAAGERITVGSLLAKDYVIAGAIATASGAPGLFLRNGSRVYLCFIAETPQSATVATQYCKPVD